MGEKPEGVGVTFEVGQVIPFLWRKLVPERSARTLAEICLYGFFAGMSERRVAEVMGEACRRHYITDVAEAIEYGAVVRVARAQTDGYLTSQRSPHTRHFEAVSETVVDEDAARKRKHLGLVLEPPERG